MQEYIDRDKLLDIIPNPRPTDVKISRNAAIRDMLELVLSCKAADVAPVRHGHWICWETHDWNDNYDFICSCCNHGDQHQKNVKVPYCWYCGAKMDEEGM